MKMLRMDTDGSGKSDGLCTSKSSGPRRIEMYQPTMPWRSLADTICGCKL